MLYWFSFGSRDLSSRRMHHDQFLFYKDSFNRELYRKAAKNRLLGAVDRLQGTLTSRPRLDGLRAGYAALEAHVSATA